MNSCIRTAAFIVAAFLSAHCFGQEITLEEMKQLDAFRQQLAAQGLAITPEQEARMLQRMRALKALNAQMTPSQGGGVELQRRIEQARAQAPDAAPVSAVIAVAQPTEEQLKQRLLSMPEGARVASLTFMPDGLIVNGQRFVDSAGRAERFGVDRARGQVGYVTRTAGEALVRIARPGSAAEPLTIGVLRVQGPTQSFETSTGKTLAGELFFPTADGALVLRDSVGFRYVAGVGTSQFSVPAGWTPASLQRGDLSETGWILLQKDLGDQPQQLPGVGLIKKLGEIAGTTQANDFQLFDTQTGKTVVLDISADGQVVTDGSQCRRRGVVNVCDQFTSYQSIWEKDGSPNMRHYFWRVDWQSVNGRPIAVVQEKRSVQVNAYDLNSGAKVNLFERGLGLRNMDATITADGRLRVTAMLGFEPGVVEDVGARLSAETPP